MSVSFLKVWENVHPDAEHQDGHRSPLLGSGDNGEILTAIRNGLHLRKSEECGNFWDDFISVCNNSTALAALLGVKAEQVSTWSLKVRNALEKVEGEDDENSNKPELVQTGDVGEEGDVAGGNQDEGQPGQTRPQ
jgi:hypothetical protein